MAGHRVAPRLGRGGGVGMAWGMNPAAPVALFLSCGTGASVTLRLLPRLCPRSLTGDLPLLSRIPFGDHPLKLERYRED